MTLPNEECVSSAYRIILTKHYFFSIFQAYYETFFHYMVYITIFPDFLFHNYAIYTKKGPLMSIHQKSLLLKLANTLCCHCNSNFFKSCNICTCNIVAFHAITFGSCIKIVEDIDHDIFQSSIHFFKCPAKSFTVL